MYTVSNLSENCTKFEIYCTFLDVLPVENIPGGVRYVSMSRSSRVL